MVAKKSAKKVAAKKAPAARVISTPPAPPEPTPPAAPAGPALVTVRANGSVRVINERIDDRERHENGSQVLVANEEGHFIVGPNQSLRVVGI
jgi:hypothetical protein